MTPLDYCKLFLPPPQISARFQRSTPWQLPKAAAVWNTGEGRQPPQRLSPSLQSHNAYWIRFYSHVLDWPPYIRVKAPAGGVLVNAAAAVAQSRASASRKPAAGPHLNRRRAHGSMGHGCMVAWVRGRMDCTGAWAHGGVGTCVVWA